MKLSLNSEELTLLISYESQKIETIKCRMNDRIGDILKKFAPQINEEFSNLTILYGGNIIKGDDLKKNFSQIINSFDKIEKTMNLLIYRKDLKVSKKKTLIDTNQGTNIDEINIILIIDSKSPFIMKGKRDEPIKDIFNRHSMKIGLEINKLIFKYGMNEIDLNNTFNQIANETDKNCSGITLSVYTSINKNPLVVYFIYNNNKYKIDCFKENKIGDICYKYCSIMNKNMINLFFKYKGMNIDFDQTFDEFLSNVNKYNSSSKLPQELLKEDNKNTLIEYMDIIVSEPESNKKNIKKILLILLAVVLIIIILVIVIVIVTKKDKDKDDELDSVISTNIPVQSTDETPKQCDPGFFIPSDDSTLQDCKKCSVEGCLTCSGTYDEDICTSCGELKSFYDSNNKIIKCSKTCEIGSEEKCLTCDNDTLQCKSCNVGYKLVNGLCKADFFIKAVYQTNAPGDDINLYYFGINNVLNKMIVDGEEVSKATHFQFPNAGIHTIYLKFQKTTSYISNNGEAFSGIKKLISVTFTDFDEYNPGMTFYKIFKGCTSLTSVDLSKISLNFQFKAESMFEECINLRHVNFNAKMLNISGTLNKMFYNCYSLTSVDLSKVNFINSLYLEYVFFNCTSLKTINLKSFKLDSALSLYKMFQNCASLEYIDLSSFQPKVLTEISYLFYNCNSLTSINLNNFYTSRVTNMNYVFFNCTSLKFLDISSFNTENTGSMNYMFSYCKSLTSINFGSNFVTNNVDRMNSLFSHCYSLQAVNYPFSISGNAYNLSECFYDCYSLTSINLENFHSNKINDFNSMFYNCYNLRSIDTSNFDFNAALKTEYMFSGCYSLTSIDLSRSSERSVDSYKGMFYNCPNLSFLDISFLTGRFYNSFFNENISDSGTIVLKRSYFNDYSSKSIIPSGWEHNLVD